MEPFQPPVKRFETLDGLRGVAALSVALLHTSAFFLGGHLVEHAYLAVDFFFLISGVVIAHAYEAQLQAGGGFIRFVRARMRRLYPLYLLGLLLGTSVAEITHVIPTPLLVIVVAMSAAFIPLIVGDPASAAFRVNGPSWSLFFEVVVNLAYGLIGARLSHRALMLIMAISVGGLVIATLHANSACVGWSVGNFWGGFARVGFSFPLGVLLYRAHRSGKLRSFGGAHSGRLMLIFLAIMTLPVLGARTGGFNGVVDLVIVLGLFPLLGALAVEAQPSAKDRPAYTTLAAISYPLYAIHFPILELAVEIDRALLLPTAPVMITALAVAVGAAWMLSGVRRKSDRSYSATRRGRAVANG